MAATTSKKRQAALPAGQKPRICCVCFDEPDSFLGVELVKPCRVCESDYCTECVIEWFTMATHDGAHMPPKCHAIIQLHTIIHHLSDEQIDKYRRKFQEWIVPVKVYCPSRTCSAFIAERFLPQPPTSAPEKPVHVSLRPFILNLLDNIADSPAARFFRGDLQLPSLPERENVNLATIRERVDSYQSIEEVASDMRLIGSNAAEYEGQPNAVTEAADKLLRLFNAKAYAAIDALLEAPREGPASPLQHFPCPECHIAICTICHNIEHGNTLCDHGEMYAEEAMLKALAIKRCPCCRFAVRKMHGCNHMECRCKAHFCYYCQRKWGDCQGDCEEAQTAVHTGEDQGNGEESDESDGSDMEDDPEPDIVIDRHEPSQAPGSIKEPLPNDLVESLMDSTGMPRDQAMRLLAATSGHVGAAMLRWRGEQGSQDASRLSSQSPSPPELVHDDIGSAPASEDSPQEGRTPVDLDAGGARVWEAAEFDFGSEPDEPEGTAFWHCTHKFETFKIPDDGFNRGDFDRMQCNRCLNKVAGKKAPPPPKPRSCKKTSKLSASGKKPDIQMEDVTRGTETGADDKKEACECTSCRIVVCPACRDKFIAEAQSAH